MSQSPTSIQVFYEATPNPEAMKFIATQALSPKTVFFEDVSQARLSPLAMKLFGFPWMQAVLIGPNFVTITKQNWVDWPTLADPLAHMIQEHLESGEPVLLEEQGTSSSSNDFADDPNDSPIVREIKRVLNFEVRPAVAMDGGDIIFHKYEEQKVYVYMQGSCSGCPSSTMTLKQGIEARLKEVIPEIDEVIAL